MKIQYKAAIVMILFGALIVFFLSAVFNRQNRSIAISNELNNAQNLAEEIALHLESRFHETISVALTMTTPPAIKDALRRSNSTFSSLNNDQRNIEINSLNQR